MTNVFIVTPTEMTVSKDTLNKVAENLRDIYGLTDKFFFRQDERNNDPKFLSDNLLYDPESAIVLAIGNDAMPLYGKVAMETEIVPMLREYSNYTSFEILATYVLPLLQKAQEKYNKM